MQDMGVGFCQGRSMYRIVSMFWTHTRTQNMDLFECNLVLVSKL
jgi:hypothetical protein